MAKQHSNHDQFEEVKFISLFVSLSYETKHPLSPSLEPKPCPPGRQDVVLDNSQDSTLILHNENFCAMDMLLSAPCPYKDSNHFLILVSKLFRRMVVDAFVYQKYCKSRGYTVVLTSQPKQEWPMLGGEARNYTTIDSYRTKFPRSSLRP